MKQLIDKGDRFFVAGQGHGGSAICRALRRKGYENILKESRDRLDPLDPEAVRRWFEVNKPTVVVLAAAK